MYGEIVLWLIVLIAIVVIGAWLLNYFYIRAPKDRAFVRTGVGGERVVRDDGCLVLPFIHVVTPVNLNLSRIMITVGGENSMITADRARVDIDSEFFLRVANSADAISVAASSLGNMTSKPAELATFFEGEFLGVLRAVASEMTLLELHENRQDFIDTIHERMGRILKKFGLELDTVAIRNLDQTALEHFNPANRFDAEGMTRLIEMIEERRQARNEIEQRAIVAIRASNLASEKEALQLERESQIARLDQEREIEGYRARQSALIARERAEREAAVSASRIEMEQQTSQREISANEEIERRRIAADRSLDESRMKSEQQLRQLEIVFGQELEFARIDSSVAMIIKEVEEADARIKNQEVLFKAVNAKQSVATAREIGSTERTAAIARIVAEKEAEIHRLHSAASAEAERLRNDADNLLSKDARLGRLRGQLIEKLEVIVRETVKPIEKIDGIKVVHVSGGSGGGGGGRSPTDEVIDSVMRYRVQAPLIDELMKDIGMDGSKIGSVDRLLTDAKDMQTIRRGAEPEKKDKN